MVARSVIGVAFHQSYRLSAMKSLVLLELAKGHVELSAVLIHQPEGDVFFFTAHIVVGGPIVPPGFPTARVVADLHRGFAIDTQALDLPVWVSIRLRQGLAILVGEVGKDGIGFRKFFWGLALITLRRR